MSRRTVYISVGNSDDKLTQDQWAQFQHDINTELALPNYDMHGRWYSLPTMRWQNACWCVEVPDERATDLKRRLRKLAEEYDQDSIAWAVAETEFLSPAVRSAL